MIDNNKKDDMSQKKAIALVLDDGYADKALPAILDLWTHSGRQYPIYVMHGANLSQSSKFRIRKFADIHRIELQFYDISSKGGVISGLKTRNHISLVAYAKLLLGELLWEGVNFVYYFDVDILVLRDLGELFAIEPKKAIAAVDHRLDKERGRLLGTNGRYLNSGVLVANLPRWKAINAMKMFEEAVKNHAHKFKYNDQDVFAVAFDEETEELPIEYNFMLNRCNPYVVECGDYDWDPEKINPAILHFIGPVKPWSANSMAKSHKMWRRRITLL